MAYDVFISYSSHDQKIVEGLSAYLEQNGVRCFVAYRDIPRGTVWATAITEAIENCQMMVVVFSENFNNSDQVDREIELCAEEKKPILTFKLTDHKFTGAKKYYLKNINWIDAFPNPKKSFGKLLESIKRLIDNTPPLVEIEEKVVTVIKEEPKIVEEPKEPKKPKKQVENTENSPMTDIEQGKKEGSIWGQYKKHILIGMGVVLLLAVLFGINRSQENEHVIKKEAQIEEPNIVENRDSSIIPNNESKKMNTSVKKDDTNNPNNKSNAGKTSNQESTNVKNTNIISQNAIDYNNMGVTYDNQQNYNKAIECYQKAISINPQYANAYHNMGVAYAQLQNYDKAIECYKKVILVENKGRGTYDDANTGSRLLYIDEGNDERMIKWLQKIVSIDPQDKNAYLIMGETYYRRQNYDKAIECYQKVVLIDPQNDGVYFFMGQIYDQELQNYDKAIECFLKTISINPQYAEVYFWLGAAYGEKNDNKKRIESYQKAAQLGFLDSQRWLKHNGYTW